MAARNIHAPPPPQKLRCGGVSPAGLPCCAAVLPGLLDQSCLHSCCCPPACSDAAPYGCELCHGGPRRPPALPPAARPAPSCCVAPAAQLPSPSLLLLCSTPSSVCRLCSARAAQAVLPNCSKAAQIAPKWDAMQHSMIHALPDPAAAAPLAATAAQAARRQSAPVRKFDTRKTKQMIEQDHKLACSFREMPRTGPRWIRFIRCCATTMGRQGGGDHVGTQHASPATTCSTACCPARNLHSQHCWYRPQAGHRCCCGAACCECRHLCSCAKASASAIAGNWLCGHCCCSYFRVGPPSQSLRGAPCCMLFPCCICRHHAASTLLLHPSSIHSAAPSLRMCTHSGEAGDLVAQALGLDDRHLHQTQQANQCAHLNALLAGHG